MMAVLLSVGHQAADDLQRGLFLTPIKPHAPHTLDVYLRLYSADLG
jgi:hypothetical protein